MNSMIQENANWMWKKNVQCAHRFYRNDEDNFAANKKKVTKKLFESFEPENQRQQCYFHTNYLLRTLFEKLFAGTQRSFCNNVQLLNDFK